MNLSDILAILKEVNLLVTTLKEMGITMHGTVDLGTLLTLFHPKP